ncbi:MAG: dTDP-4-dehydrorhamnose 3,5-epimerase [Ignavibacteria bacterium]|jgi:dTDP-4-dehydrorhamnose 3,5-epimerase
MKISKTDLEGVLIIEPDVFPDDRGFFFESFSKMKYEKEGFNFNFVQDNISKSTKGTIRGLHYQVGEFAQGKLCQVVLGKVYDCAIDIRFGSPTFGRYVGVELSGENHLQFWLPPGFAHGFSVLSDEAIFMYKCTNYYSKKDERSIIFNDADLGIDWKVEVPVISEKDLLAKKFKEIEKDFFSIGK